MAQVTPKPPRSGKQKAAPQQPSDLEVLHPEREVKLSVGAVTVREYGNVEWLRLLPQAEPLVANITAMLSAGAPPSYEDVLAIIAHHTDGLLPLVVQSVDRDVDWVETLNSNDLEVGGERAFFRQPRQKPRHGAVPGGNGSAEPIGWGEIYATLIAHGHRAGEIGGYTARQLELYFREALRLDRQHSASRLADVNAAFAGGEAAKGRLKALRKD